MRNKTALCVLAAVLLGCGLFCYRPSPAVGPQGNLQQPGWFVLAANNQATSLFVPVGSAARLEISGTFTGTIAFQLSQDGGTSWSAVSLYNLATGSATDQSATAAGAWLFAPATGNGGLLQAVSTAWTSGKAQVALTDLSQSRSALGLTLLPSAARTAAVQTVDMRTPPWKGAVFYLNVTAASGTGGLTLTFKVKDPVSGQYVGIFTAGSAKVGVGTYAYAIAPYYPFAVDNGGSAVYSLTDEWLVLISTGDGTSYTYSVGCTLLP